MTEAALAHSSNNIAGLPARRLAVDLVEAVLCRRQTLDALSKRIEEARLPREDRAFAMALTLATLRHYGALQALVQARLAKVPPVKRVEIILAVSLSQMMVLKTPAHAAVALGVELAKENPATEAYVPLVNAVLRRLSEDAGLQIDLKQVLPDWLYKRWVKTYGAETTLDMAKAQLAEPPLDLSVKGNPQIWVQKLGGELLPTGTLRLLEHKGSIINLPGFDEGAWWVQDAGALLSVLACGDIKGKDVLDLCAAPGGKTAALAARGAQVTAVDCSQPRLGILEQNMRRLKLETEVICADATRWQPKKLYDAILLDAPCSSTGTLRRHPDVAWVKTEKDIMKLAALQAKLLQRAAAWVKPGGILVYSTCSLEPEEGEIQIEKFLREQQQFTLHPVMATEIGKLDEVLTQPGIIRARPDMLKDKGGIDGFFVARLLKA
jgi:16S rRNA (cytosine967-C5)-methyltransferase